MNEGDNTLKEMFHERVDTVKKELLESGARLNSSRRMTSQQSHRSMQQEKMILGVVNDSRERKNSTKLPNIVPPMGRRGSGSGSSRNGIGSIN
jgi:hypothetical protein